MKPLNILNTRKDLLFEYESYALRCVFLIPKPSLMVEAVKAIDEIFEEMEKDSKQKGQAFQDIQGDVYESEVSYKYLMPPSALTRSREN